MENNNCTCRYNLYCLHSDGKTRCYGCGDEYKTTTNHKDWKEVLQTFLESTTNDNSPQMHHYGFNTEVGCMTENDFIRMCYLVSSITDKP